MSDNEPTTEAGLPSAAPPSVSPTDEIRALARELREKAIGDLSMANNFLDRESGAAFQTEHLLDVYTAQIEHNEKLIRLCNAVLGEGK